ncbi:dirigent protein 11 [Momordica charantia]|uniref:Dirigent protein n=1 Tax=Momordica charantia TaxID=3673 RepID=A0A6J1D409_MOMCH|nr:dirigent protein 11 [Momordica charantia]
MMKTRIIFCAAVCLAFLVVILLALLSPVPNKKQSKHGRKPSWADLSLYIQQPHSTGNAKSNNMQPVPRSDSGVFVFLRTLTEGPENTSRIVGNARGFIIPNEQFAHSSFNVIYLSFDTPEYSGSLSVHAKHIGHENRELAVVGGTGSFAFAQGIAIFLQTDGQASVTDTTYHLKLQLQFPK